MDQLGYHSSDLSVEAERKVARTFMGRIEWEMIVIGLGQFTLWIATWVLVIVGTIPLYAGFLIALFGAVGFLISGSYLKTNLPLSIGFLNVPAFLIFIPITTFMIASDPYLQRFVKTFTEINLGKAFYTGLNNLGEMIFEDYEKNRKKKLG